MKNKNKQIISKKTGLILSGIILFVGVVVTVSLANPPKTEESHIISNDFVIKEDKPKETPESSTKTEAQTSTEVPSNLNLDSPQNEEQLLFVEQFLEEYCNFSSIDERNQNIAPLLTKDMQKFMGVDVSVPVEMESESTEIEIYQNKEGDFLGLVKQTMAERPQVQLYKVKLQKTEASYLISEFSSPTAD